MTKAFGGMAVVSLLLLANNAEANVPALQAKGPLSPVSKANAAARVQPQLETFQGAVQKFTWNEGGLYQVYAAPGRITDIVLEPGEQLAGSGPVAAGDTARWIIGDTESGAGENRRVHVLIKPSLPGLATNLVINTDRRTYYLELRASAATYMASVAWTYPQGSLVALARPTTAQAAPPPAAPSPPPPPSVAAFRFDYRISGDRVAWRPQQVFDDGQKVYLIFPANVAANELPPLFLIDEAGRAELVNTRLNGRRLEVDRLFDRAELRLGDKRKSRKVRIERIASRAP